MISQHSVNGVMMMRFFGVTTIAAATLLSVPAHAVSLFTDRTAWEAALGGAALTEDGFDTPIAQAASIAFDSGVISAGIGGAPGSHDNSVGGGVYLNRIDSEDPFNGFESITWTFPSPVFAFGADWIEVAGGEVLTVTADFDGTGPETVNFGTELGNTGFLGFVGLADFTAITFGTAFPDPEFTEGFSVDNLAFASAGGDTAGLPLLLSGLGALALLRRRC